MTREEMYQVLRKIRDCDRLFDGHYVAGVVKHDRQQAYNELRVIALELLEDLTA